MMMNREDIVTAVIAASGGSLIGRIRLQKVIYLLDHLGLCSGFDYEYHHYGPYSADLASATEDAKAFKKITEKYEYRKNDGIRYSVFSTTSKESPEVVGDLEKEKATKLINLMKANSATVLELAATIHWLKNHEKINEWEQELIQRKGAKAKDERIKTALGLLREIGLEG